MRGGIILAIGLMLTMSDSAMSAKAEVTQLQDRPRLTRREGGVTATFFVAANPRPCFRILSDHARLPEFMPNLDACIVRAAGPRWVEVEMRNSRGRMVLRRSFDPPHQIRWNLVESPMLKRVDGSWRLDAVPGGTVLTYDSEVEPALPIPRFVIQFVQEDALEALVSNVRRRIDSGGTWVKPGFTKGSAP